LKGGNKKMTLLDKLEYLMRKRNLNKRQFSLQSGLPYSTIDNLWKRGTDSMRLPTFIKICSFFNVTMDSMAYDEREIQYKTEQEANLPLEESDLLNKYRHLNADGKQMVETVLNTALWQAEQNSLENQDIGLKLRA
jgi:DNA-binding Xre family transcriptional regulator